MIREFIVNQSMIEIHRRLRREGLLLIRMIPKRRPRGDEAYVIWYIR
jgi:hypothetical protein